ncbi:MAG: hypothetical protein ACE5GO_08715 [Anaerolineales bacterium]
MLLTTIPYLLGFANQGDAWRFTGFVFGVEDGNSYIAKMLSGAEGAWLFRTPYTAVFQRGVLAFLPYILLGKLTAGPGQHEQLVALFHLYRFVAGVLAILAMYDFISYFVLRVRLRRLGAALAAFGGGLGWVLILLGRENWLGSLPLDFYSPETFGFLSLYGLPHLAIARALLLRGLLAYLRNAEGRSGQYNDRGTKSGLLWLLMGLFQPLTVIVAWAVVGAHLAGLALFGNGVPDKEYRSRAVRRGLVAGLVSSPIVLYTLWAFTTDPFLRVWTDQNLILSPHPLHYLVAYGLVLPFAVRGARRLLRQNPARGWLPVAWAAIMPALAYAPHNLQRRLPEGVWVALVILALKAEPGANQPAQRPRLPRSGRMRFHTLGVFFFLFVSTLLLLAGGVMGVADPKEPVFRPVEEIAAFQLLREQAEPGDVVLASFETGNALPAWAPVRVVIGHGPESVRLDELRLRVAAFYQPDTDDCLQSLDADRKALLDEFDVRYVFWGRAERNLGSWDPREAPYLRVVKSDGLDAIFEVPKKGGGGAAAATPFFRASSLTCFVRTP